MRNFLIILLFLAGTLTPALGEEEFSGIRGEAEAIAKAEAMVEALGGLYIWRELKGTIFKMRWYNLEDKDSVIETEIIDLTRSATFYQMKSEVNYRAGAYTPTSQWRIRDGKVIHSSDEDARANENRAHFNLYRIARGIAVGDPFYEVRLGENGRLEFYDPEGVLHTWVRLNAWNEPVVWGTNDFRYIFGPMKSYGNLRVPAWAVYGEGIWRYEMISLEASTERPDPAAFEVPEKFRE